ncbi:MAG: hypothetical protein QM817_32360 [Archangium sp.]
MGSDLFSVRVLKKSENTATLEVKSIHPGALAAPRDAGFALMVLHDGASRTDPLAREIGSSELLDAQWQQRHVKNFISTVKGRKAKTLELTVTVTDPAWLRHATRGKRWASRAFQLVANYDAPKAPAANEGENGFEPVPPKVFAALGVPKTKLKRLEMPAFGDGAYRVVERHAAAKITPALLKQWDGRAVEVVGLYSTMRGALIESGNQSEVFRLFIGGSMLSSGSLQGARSIGLLELKPRARFGERLKYPLPRAD